MVTSFTSPWSTSCMNFENVTGDSLAPELPACTTLQSRTPESRITSQNATVLTVEFTLNAPNQPSPDEYEKCLRFQHQSPTCLRPKSARFRAQPLHTVLRGR